MTNQQLSDLLDPTTPAQPLRLLPECPFAQTAGECRRILFLTPGRYIDLENYEQNNPGYVTSQFRKLAGQEQDINQVRELIAAIEKELHTAKQLIGDEPASVNVSDDYLLT